MSMLPDPIRILTKLGNDRVQTLFDPQTWKWITIKVKNKKTSSSEASNLSAAGTLHLHIADELRREQRLEAPIIEEAAPSVEPEPIVEQSIVEVVQ